MHAVGCSYTNASSVSIFYFPKNKEAGSQVDKAGAAASGQMTATS